jgi:hypothetical protein
MGEEMIQRMQEHGIPSLAQFYTSRIKYDPDRFAEDSAALRGLLQESLPTPRARGPGAHKKLLLPVMRLPLVNFVSCERVPRVAPPADAR